MDETVSPRIFGSVHFRNENSCVRRSYGKKKANLKYI